MTSSLTLLADLPRPPGEVGAMARHGDLLYLARADAVTVVDIADLTAPRTVGSYRPRSPAGRIAVAGRDGYLCVEDGIELLDTSDPRAIRERGFLELAGPPQDVALVGTFLYTTDGEAVQAWALTERERPVAAGRCGIPLCGRLTPAERDLLFVAADCEGMFIVDLAKPARPSRVGRFCGPGDVTKVAVRDRHAFIADYSGGGLAIVDTSDPRKPRAVATHDEGIIGDVATAGSRLHLATGDLVTLDVTDPVHAHVSARSSSRAGDTAWALLADRDHLFALGEAGLTIWRTT